MRIKVNLKLIRKIISRLNGNLKKKSPARPATQFHQKELEVPLFFEGQGFVNKSPIKKKFKIQIWEFCQKVYFCQQVWVKSFNIQNVSVHLGDSDV